MPHVDVPQSICLGAIARRDITPPVGMYHRMWGAATHDRSTGVHRPLLATALALAPRSSAGADDAKKSAQVVVGIDHCLLWDAEMDALRAAVSERTGLSRDQVQISMSHTHAAGLLDPERAALPGGQMIAGYLVGLAEAIIQAVREALEALRPVNIVYGTGRCGLATHRDFWDVENKLFACGFNPTGAADDTLLVARVTNAESRVVATVVNYACHLTTLAWDNTLVSPDYVGALRELVESATDAPCLFLQGASGDLGPRHGFVGDVAVADRNGRELGYATLAALEPLPEPGVRYQYLGPVISGATIGTWGYQPLDRESLESNAVWDCQTFAVPLPYRPDLPTREQTEVELTRWQKQEQICLAEGNADGARECRAQIERMTRQLTRLAALPPGPTVPLTVTLWQLGEALWVFVQGEHYSRLQQALRKQFPAHPIILATVTNGWRPGYVPTAETYGRGIYQESIAQVAAGSLEAVVAAIARRIESLLGSK